MHLIVHSLLISASAGKVVIDFTCPGCNYREDWNLDLNAYPEGYTHTGCCGVRTHMIFDQDTRTVLVSAYDEDSGERKQWSVTPPTGELTVKELE